MPTLTFPSITPKSVSFGVRFSTQINTSPLSGAVQTVEVPGARWVADIEFSDLDSTETRELVAFLLQLRGAAGRFYLYDHSHRSAAGSNLAAGTVIVDVKEGSTIDTGTALGTHSTTTLQDTTATFITDDIIAAGDYIYNVDNDELRVIDSFTEDTITVTVAWTSPSDSDSYEIYAKPSGNTITTSGWNTSESNLLLPGDYIELEGPELKMVTSAVNSDGSGIATITFEPPIRTAPNDGSTIGRSDCRAIMLLTDDENRWITDNAGLLSNVRFSCAEAY